MIRTGVREHLGYRSQPKDLPGGAPPVALVLEVDQQYRRHVEAGDLPKIAPRRFNPTAEAWLPVLHTSRDDWHFTALFSNTAQAHRYGRTRDWVIVYFYNGDHQEGQYTVVTETAGPMKGKRVIRGLEAACHQLKLVS
jgi:putative hydrolase